MDVARALRARRCISYERKPQPRPSERTRGSKRKKVQAPNASGFPYDKPPGKEAGPEERCRNRGPLDVRLVSGAAAVAYTF